MAEKMVSISKFDKEIAELQKDILDKTACVEQINSRKAIILERQKYQVDDVKKHNNLVNLKETELKINNNLIDDYLEMVNSPFVSKFISLKNRSFTYEEEKYYCCFGFVAYLHNSTDLFFE